MTPESISDVARAILAASIPIGGASLAADGTITVQYGPGATDAQRQQAQAIVDGWPLEQARADKLAAIDAAYQAALADGVTVNSITLAAGEADQAALGNGLNLLNAALISQQATTGTMVSTLFGRPVTDAAGGSHDMTAGQYIALALAYAATIGAWQGRRNALAAAARAAASTEELDAISVSIP